MELVWDILSPVLKSEGIEEWNVIYNPDPEHKAVRFDEKGNLIAEISNHDDYTHKGSYTFSRDVILNCLQEIIENGKEAEKFKKTYLEKYSQ